MNSFGVRALAVVVFLIYFYFIPQLFAICTGTISKWCIVAEGTSRRELSSTLL
jgi:hypothetical protein